MKPCDTLCIFRLAQRARAVLAFGVWCVIRAPVGWLPVKWLNEVTVVVFGAQPVTFPEERVPVCEATTGALGEYVIGAVRIIVFTLLY